MLLTQLWWLGWMPEEMFPGEDNNQPDPNQTRQVLSMIHSARSTVPPSSDHYSHLKVVLICEILKVVPTTCETDDMRENSDHYRPWLWVGLVDQKANQIIAYQASKL